MKIEQLYTNCLAQAAYYIESNGEVAIIDPLRDYATYIEKAKADNASIKYVFETHFHADFVSGHIDLAKITGAQIVYGPTTETQFAATIASDGQFFQLGNIKIQVLHTPGHTLESSCFLLLDENNQMKAVFTGDTLFVGDVGRPDLLDGIMTKEELAAKMFHSLKKLTALPDDVIVYPAHGAGSACGKNIGKETFSTIGEQKAKNYALQPMTEAQFVEAVCEGIAPAPAYFFKDAAYNKQGYAPFEEVISAGMKDLSIDSFKQLVNEGSAIIDTRHQDEFENGFVPGSINVGLNGQFAIFAASIFALTDPIVLVCKPGTEKESVERLTRVGFDNIKGTLAGGFDSWKDADLRFDMVISITPEEFALDVKHNPEVAVIDVRRPGEFSSGHVSGAINAPVADIVKLATELDREKECLVHCAGGYRSMIASSYLKKQGFKNVKNVWGGYDKIKAEVIDLTAPQTV